MEGYIRDMLDLYDISSNRATPAGEDLYEIDATLERLGETESREFTSRVMKVMYVAQRARPDILAPTNFLSTRSTKCTTQDMSKLKRVLMYLHASPEEGLILSCAEGMKVSAYIDASFGVHADMKSHTGVVISLGEGSVYSASKKQGLMTKSSTEAELVAVSDGLPQVVWTREFLESQGYIMEPAVLYQDNMSTMALIDKGRSTSSRTRHIAIRYFFVKDRVDAGELKVVHMPTEMMRADILTKPLQGEHFREMKGMLLGKSAARDKSAVRDVKGVQEAGTVPVNIPHGATEVVHKRMTGGTEAVHNYVVTVPVDRSDTA